MCSVINLINWYLLSKKNWSLVPRRVSKMNTGIRRRFCERWPSPATRVWATRWVRDKLSYGDRFSGHVFNLDVLECEHGHQLKFFWSQQNAVSIYLNMKKIFWWIIVNSSYVFPLLITAINIWRSLNSNIFSYNCNSFVGMKF